VYATFCDHQALQVSTWKGMLELLKRGKHGGARAVGVSNFEHDHLMDLQKAGLEMCVLLVCSAPSVAPRDGSCQRMQRCNVAFSGTYQPRLALHAHDVHAFHVW
jgi:hypothetical protein